MKPSHTLAALSLVALLAAASSPTTAGDGHDHGPAAATSAGTALPRFAAASEAFELVGVLDGKQLTLYLDRFADNTPVRGAKIELEIAGAKHMAQAHGDDAYEVVFKEAPKPGVLPVTATITAGSEVDLLVGELDLHESAQAKAAPHQHSKMEYAAWGAGGLLGLAALLLLGRRLMSGRTTRVEVAA